MSMSICARLTLAMIVGLSLPSSVSAQDASAPQTSPETRVDDVVVEGRRLDGAALDRAVRDFVDDVTEPPPGRGVGRWRRGVCVGVANMSTPIAQRLVDRVSEVAMDVGLEPGEPGCKANILVVATDDGDAMTDGLLEARYGAFRRRHVAGTSHSNLELERFRTATRPVRWWHVTIPVVADTGIVAVRIPGREAPRIARRGPGRLRTPIQNDLRRAFVIVDVTQAEGKSVDQLADYIAMVALAQVDPDADTSAYDTILNLFAPGAATEFAGLTAWDRSYLSALYDAELNQAHPRGQTGAVGSLMSRDRQGLDGD